VGVEVGEDCGLLWVRGESGKILWTTYVPNGILDTIIIIIIIIFVLLFLCLAVIGHIWLLSST
jgi:hypothetical protein